MSKQTLSAFGEWSGLIPTPSSWSHCPGCGAHDAVGEPCQPDCPEAARRIAAQRPDPGQGGKAMAKNVQEADDLSECAEAWARYEKTRMSGDVDRISAFRAGWRAALRAAAKL